MLRYLLLVLAFFAFPMSLHKATTSYYEITTLIKNSGTPQTALAMGLQDKPDLNACQDGIPAIIRDIYAKKKGNIEKIEKRCQSPF